MKFVVAALLVAFTNATEAAGGDTTTATVAQGTKKEGDLCSATTEVSGCASGLRCAKQDGKEHCVSEVLCAGTTNYSFLDCSGMKLATGVTMSVAMLMSI